MAPGTSNKYVLSLNTLLYTFSATTNLLYVHKLYEDNGDFSFLVILLFFMSRNKLQGTLFFRAGVSKNGLHKIEGQVLQVSLN